MMRRPPRDGRLGLRIAIMATAALLLAWPYSVPLGMLAAMVGAGAGTIAAERIGRGPLRLGAGIFLGLSGASLGLVVARALVVFSWPAQWLGPIAVLAISEAVAWAALACGIAFALRLAGRRSSLLAVLEVASVACAVALSLAAHRDGMVHRPYAIGDWAWSRGLDPGIVLIVIGGLASVGLALLLFERRPGALRRPGSPATADEDTAYAARRGRLRHVLALVLLAALLVLFVRSAGGPAPKVAGDLGLTGDPVEGEAGEGEVDGQRGEGSEDDQQLGDLQFKNEYASSGSEAPVAVVVLHDDYVPPSGVFYFRQSAFSQYNGRRLVQAARDDVDVDLVDRFPSQKLRILSAPAVGSERMALPTSIGLLADHVRPFALDAPAEIGPLENPNPARFRRAFSVRSHVRIVPYEAMIGRRPGNPEWDEAQWTHYTEAPTDRRYRELAETLEENLAAAYRDDPLAQALVVKDYLDKSGIYSRKSNHAETSDPTASFLFGDKTGYCVHFAHAATFLFRSLGLPARVAAGYAVPESSRGGGSSLMVRGLNAHAWPEVYLEGLGWVVIDPAPEQSLDEAITPPDQSLQRMLGEMMRGAEDQAAFEEGMSRWLDPAFLAKIALLLALTLVLAAYAVKIHRQVVTLFAGAPTIPRIGYRAALDRLAEVGLSRVYGETRESFARRVAGRVPAFAELSDRHVAWAYGSRRVASPTELRQLAGRVRRELEGAVPLPRRILGILDPFSWLRAR